MDTKSLVHKITDTIPHELLCKQFGVKQRTIRLARENGFFPASWYVGMKQLCDEHGLACPESLFNFKTTSLPKAAPAIKRGNANRTGQGAA